VPYQKLYMLKIISIYFREHVIYSGYILNAKRELCSILYYIILLLYVLLPYLDIDYEMLPLSVSLWSCQDYWNKSYSTKPRFFMFIGSWLLLRGFDNSWKTRVLSQSATSFSVAQNWNCIKDTLSLSAHYMYVSGISQMYNLDWCNK